MNDFSELMGLGGAIKELHRLTCDIRDSLQLMQESLATICQIMLANEGDAIFVSKEEKEEKDIK